MIQLMRQSMRATALGLALSAALAVTWPGLGRAGTGTENRARNSTERRAWPRALPGVRILRRVGIEDRRHGDDVISLDEGVAVRLPSVRVGHGAQSDNGAADVGPVRFLRTGAGGGRERGPVIEHRQPSSLLWDDRAVVGALFNALEKSHGRTLSRRQVPEAAHPIGELRGVMARYWREALMGSPEHPGHAREVAEDYSKANGLVVGAALAGIASEHNGHFDKSFQAAREREGHALAVAAQLLQEGMTGPALDSLLWSNAAHGDPVRVTTIAPLSDPALARAIVEVLKEQRVVLSAPMATAISQTLDGVAWGNGRSSDAAVRALRELRSNLPIP